MRRPLNREAIIFAVRSPLFPRGGEGLNQSVELGDLICLDVSLQCKVTFLSSRYNKIQVQRP